MLSAMNSMSSRLAGAHTRTAKGHTAAAGSAPFAEGDGPRSHARKDIVSCQPSALLTAARATKRGNTMRVTDVKMVSAFVLLSAIVAPFAPAMSQGQDAASEYNNSLSCGAYFYIAYDDAKFSKEQKDAIDEIGGYYATKAETSGSKLKKSNFDVSADMERTQLAFASDSSKLKEWEQRCLAAAKLDVPNSYAKAYGK